MSEWDGQSRGNVLGYKIFIFILRHIHIRVAYFIVWFVSLYFYFFLPKREIRGFYSGILSYPKLKSEISIFRNFLQFAQSLIDKVVILAEFKGKFTFDYEGEKYLHEMAAAGKGGIILGAHAGNWEIAGHLLKRVNKPVHVLMYDGERSNIKEVLEEITGGRSFNIITIKENDFSHIYAINEVLGRGELVAMHGDRFREGSRIHKVEFLGQEANFPLGPYYLAAQCNVPICFVHTMKESMFHYHFSSSPPFEVNTKEKTEKLARIKTLAEEFAKRLEKTVQKYPFQWYNYYNFWQT